MAGKSVEEQFAEEQARLAISQQYAARNDNPDLDPMRQDQLDRNRIPGQLGEQQLSPGLDIETRLNATGGNRSPRRSLSGLTIDALHDRPYRTLALAAMAGIVLGALWKS